MGLGVATFCGECRCKLFTLPAPWWRRLLPIVVVALAAVAISGCGSVLALPTVDAGAEVRDAAPDLDAPASGDTSAENPPDAGTVEGGRDVAIAPACGGPGIEVVERCLPNCWACRWRDWSAPAPDGCSAPTGELCRPGCELCR